MSFSRRSFLLAVSAVPAAGLVRSPSVPAAQAVTAAAAVPESFPAHDPALVRELVGVSHGNVNRVRELLEGRPALANATWDWGYGDWESALGAASHVGNREIALLLLERGARPTIFSAAMLGQLDAVKAFVTASPGAQRTRGPHGISLLAHAKAGGAPSAEVVKYLEALGDADPRYPAEPLTDMDRTAVLGTYEFGSGTTERMIVSSNERGMLVIKREGTVERNLFHLGGRVFHPTGAPAVRITLGDGNPASTLTVVDGALSVTATRSRS